MGGGSLALVPAHRSPQARWDACSFPQPALHLISRQVGPAGPRALGLLPWGLVRLAAAPTGHPGSPGACSFAVEGASAASCLCCLEEQWACGALRPREGKKPAGDAERGAAGCYLRGPPALGPPAHTPGPEGTTWHTRGPGRTSEATARPAGQEPRMRLGGPAVTTAAGLGASLTRVALLDPLPPQQGASPWVPLQWMRKPRLRDAE